MILGRNAEPDKTTHHIQEWQLLELTPFILFLKLILCQLCNSNTLRNILMVFGRNVKQDEMTCRVKEWQLCLSYFWHYLSLLYLAVIMHWFLICCVSRAPFGIFWWYLVIMKNRTRWHITYKNDNFGFFLLLEFPPHLVFEFDFLSLLCNTNTLRNILMSLGTNVEQDEMTCCVQEWQLWRDWVDIFFFLKKRFLVFLSIFGFFVN